MAKVGAVWAPGTWSTTCWEEDTWAGGIIVPSAASRGTYASEHASAVANLAAAKGFAADHAGALSDLAKAGW